MFRILTLTIKIFFLYFAWLSPCYSACSGLLCTCLVTAGLVVFGNYDPTSSTPTDTTSTVTVTCTALTNLGNVSYTIALNAGNGSGGSFSPRQMALLTNRLNYNLYTDSNRSLIWGDGSSGTNLVTENYNQAGLSRAINYTVYSRIPTFQAAPVGAYVDTIGVTVTY